LARKILLADDSVTAQNMGRKILVDAGYEVTAVNNGSAALKKIAEIKPDLVVLDVYMPGYSGLEVCQRLKESGDTMRIPVLLTVGKLEPFKPEEAQRVRAEGFIVKPFEASELLSALSKLEDKIVPRPESSKTGRFARAIAAVEASDRGRNEAAEQGGQVSGQQNGWKSRLSMPAEKPAAEEKSQDESDFYNPVNRDLRTVVESPAEKPSHQPIPESHQPEIAPETNVDLAALAPPGIPKDVSPEEVAAIAAATSQIQMAEALRKEEPASPSHAAELHTAEPGFIASSPESVSTADTVTGVPSSSQISEVQVSETQVTTQEKADYEPVTMAATGESASTTNTEGSRWTAVPVALQGDEAAVSLEAEMQKTCASAASDTIANQPAGLAGTQSGATQASSEIMPAASTEAAVLHTESGVAQEHPSQEREAAPQTTASTKEFLESETSNVAASSSMSTEAPAVKEQEVAAATATASDNTTNDASAPVDQAASESPASHFVNVVDTNPAGIAAQNERESQPTATTSNEADGQNAAEITAVSAVDSRSEAGGAQAHDENKPVIDPETVKTAAAAWASWRQIRDTSNTGGSRDSQLDEGSPREPATDLPAESASRAVAAGAEQSAPVSSGSESNRNSNGSESDGTDVANIVDSMLADLRPKLMEELARKMTQKK
jgi:two-component system chemotaxis response regulator CheY